MERLTKKDGANRNIIEVERYSDEDWIIVENTKYRTISFHSKAVDKLAEFEDFMEEMNFESLEDICEVLVKFKKNINVIYQLKQENQALKQQLAEKEKENEKLKAVVDAVDKLKQFSVDMEDYCLVDIKNADKIFYDNQDKINFAIEQLEKVKGWIIEYSDLKGQNWCHTLNYLNNQIKQLKEMK